MKKCKTYLGVRVPLRFLLNKTNCCVRCIAILEECSSQAFYVIRGFFFLMLLVSEIPLSEAINFDIAIVFLFLFSSELSHIEASKGADFSQITTIGKWNCIFIYSMQNSLNSCLNFRELGI